MPATEKPMTPTIISAVNIPAQATSSCSADRVLATSLDFHADDDEEETFHESNRCRMMMQCFPVKKHLDPMWQMAKWLQACEEGLDKEKINWWLLLLPLTD